MMRTDLNLELRVCVVVNRHRKKEKGKTLGKHEGKRENQESTEPKKLRQEGVEDSLVVPRRTEGSRE